jgi:hypothetical protein
MQTTFPHNLPTGSEDKPTLKEKALAHAPIATKALASIGLAVVLILLLVLGAVTVKYAGVALKSSYSAAVSLSSKIFTTSPITTSPTTTTKPESAGTVNSGASFTLSWNHLKKTAAGSYSLSYPCVDSLSIKATTPENGTETVYCNKEFLFINHNNELGLTVRSEKYHSVDLPITILFTKNGEKTASVSGVIYVTVVNNAIASSTDSTDTNSQNETIVASVSTTTTTKPTTNTGNNTGGTTIKNGEQAGNTTSITYTGGTTVGSGVNNPNGKPDLRPVIMETGYLDSSNAFVRSDTPSRANRVAVRFRIENIGDKVSGPFRFNAYLPTYPSQTFNSEVQLPIYPGDRIEYVLGFDRAINGVQQFHVQVDGGNDIVESNENNNDGYVNINIQ